ncbi:hypothetical protein BJ166DRAFT_181365 [Pestalotiopsis sp. NC0098]|nr:hypothetical protein BJ166DRAFT_181365 [Pestalotiopsis sp. NC0098]
MSIIPNPLRQLGARPSARPCISVRMHVPYSTHTKDVSVDGNNTAEHQQKRGLCLGVAATLVSLSLTPDQKSPGLSPGRKREKTNQPSPTCPDSRRSDGDNVELGSSSHACQSSLACKAISVGRKVCDPDQAEKPCCARSGPHHVRNKYRITKDTLHVGHGGPESGIRYITYQHWPAPRRDDGLCSARYLSEKLPYWPGQSSSVRPSPDSRKWVDTQSMRPRINQRSY